MRRYLFAGAAMLGLLALAPPIAAQRRPGYTTGAHNISLPADWQARFIRYATVDKADRKIIRHLFVNPEAFAAATPGAPLPHGTLIIMADARARVDATGTPLRDQQGRFIAEPGWIAIAAQEKQPGWGEGYPPEMRNGEWEYAAFTGTGERRNIALGSCFNCHITARSGQDFAFNFWDYVQAR
ncbi:cytochrome P460 family protein [Falsiroseomonas selenitidurans]|uniref:Cytochrome P460 family protein n=1 Tax=Falsiroseomonas selenitidurans TaxID=2716335 RepID=A0ABX1EBP8_9PROT|nr:cytochrome P460 family protein [Falsiroseomonas selenitidurans]NKC34251.1 cytochrome P460 family protein [Falsiroseomonas selenitidurans]